MTKFSFDRLVAWAAAVALGAAGCSDESPAPLQDAASSADSTGADALDADAAAADGKTADATGKDAAYSDAQLFPDLPQNSSPTLAWLAPAEGAAVAAYQAFACTATVSDGQTATEDLGYVLEISDSPKEKPALIAAKDGQVSFAVPGLAPGPHTLKLTVTDGQGGLAVVERKLLAVVGLAAPVVAIAPAKPTSVDDLAASVQPPSAAVGQGGWSGSAELKFQWFRDNIPQGWATYPQVPASQTYRGEVWRVEVKAWVDGQWTPAGQASVEIGNAAPGPVGLAFDATPPHVAGVALCAVHTPASDPDGDELSYGFAWTLDGKPLPGADGAVLALAKVAQGKAVALIAAQVGQKLACVVTAKDGQGGETATTLEALLGPNPGCETGDHPCDLAALCSATTTAALTCTCKPGYTGDGLSCADTDECATATAGCSANAACVNLPGSATCTCSPGYSGDGKTCSDIDECSAATAPCGLSADCSNTAGGFSCACQAGFAGDGFSCVNVNECKAGTAKCDPAAQCSDTAGSYVCECPPGYDGNGLKCLDIDECAEPALSQCSAAATCSNFAGGFQCSCKSGYEGDGFVCQDVDECSATPEVCPATSTCSNLDASYLCKCKPGYLGDGIDCLNIDECANGTANCSSLASCADTDGGYSCTCKPGYAGDGKTCVPQ